MGQGEELEILRILLVGICGMFIMALAIIFFFVTYQRRLLRQQKKQQILESSHQKDLLEASMKSQENERHRIAKDLHDDIGALLSTSKLYLGQLMDEMDDKEQLSLTRKIGHLHDDMIQSIRNIAQDLRPVVLESMGLAMAIKSLTKQINESKKIKVQFDHEQELNLTLERQLQLYRIVQELISNTLKHAGAENVWIGLSEQSGNIHLSYRDDGTGFTPGKGRPSGLGLKNIESRVSLLNGNITYHSSKRGIHVSLSVPNDIITVAS